MKTTLHAISTHYQIIGSGPTLILLHGWLCDWQIWSPVISTLSENFRLVLPDLPAFGQSAAGAPDWNSNHYAQWLAALIDETVPGGENFALGGHSFGGKISALYAARYASGSAKRLSHLFLIDSSGLPPALSPQAQAQQKLLTFVPDKLKQLIPARFKHRLLTATGSATDHFKSNEAQRILLKQIVREDITDVLPTITVPTTLIWGELDHETPLDQGQRFAALIPRARLEIFAQAGHFPFVDNPQRFISSITSTLKPNLS